MFLRGDLFLSTFPAMELVSIRPQLVSSASRWQRQKEISGQTASASLLLWRQPLYQPKSSHLSLAPSEAMQQIAEETPREVGPGGQGSSSHAQKAKPDPLPPALGGSPWAGKGDERVAAAISAPGMGSDTRSLAPAAWLPLGCCSFCCGDMEQPQSPAQGLLEACWKAGCCETRRALLA